MSDQAYRHELMKCPACGKGLDGSMPVTGDRGPKDGDFTVCVFCMEILEFQGNELVKPDITNIPMDVFPMLIKAQFVVLEMLLERRESEA